MAGTLDTAWALRWMRETARVIAAAVEKEGADLVLAGTVSTDGGTGVVPAMVAELRVRGATVGL